LALQMLGTATCQGPRDLVKPDAEARDQTPGRSVVDIVGGFRTENERLSKRSAMPSVAERGEVGENLGKAGNAPVREGALLETGKEHVHNGT